MMIVCSTAFGAADRRLQLPRRSFWLRKFDRERRFAAQIAVHSDGRGGRAMTQILSPTFFWDFSHQIRMFLTVRQKFVTIF